MRKMYLDHQTALQRQYSDPDPRVQNMEDYKGIGFDENNYSPIPLVRRVTSQQGTTRLTSTQKPNRRNISKYIRPDS